MFWLLLWLMDHHGLAKSIVTTDGTLLTKASTMTGGTTGGMDARSNKWDDMKFEGLKKRKEQCEPELDATESEGDAS